MTSLRDPVAENARRRPEAAAIVTPEPAPDSGPGSHATWAEIDRRVEACARRLRDLAEPSGARRGLAVQAPTAPDLAVLVWAAMRAGIVLVPLSPRWPPAAVRDALHRLGLRRLITDGPAHGLDAVGLAYLTRGHAVADSVPRLDLAQPFTVVHTSGSTGTPKAALHTVGNHVASARGVNERLGLGPGDRWWLDLPLEHVGGLGVLIRCALAGAAAVLPSRDLSLADNLGTLRPTHASLVPTQLARWLDAIERGADASSLRALLIGGAATPTAMLDRAVAAGLPVCTSWGMTEMTATVTATAPGGTRAALATSGAPLEGRELRIGAHGEILVRGPSRFAGYLADTLGDAATEPFDADGWFDTGDIGRLDERGRLTITGRADLQFVSGGENVQPEAIERVLRAVPGVAEAVVVPVRDARFGARPVAFVRPTDPASADGSELPAALREAIQAAVRAALPGYLAPDALYAWTGADGLKPDRPALTQGAERRAATSE